MIYIASEGMAIWGSGIIIHIFNLAFGNSKFEKSKNTNIIAKSIFSNEVDFNDILPYFTWCAEVAQTPLKSYPPIFQIVGYNWSSENIFNIPYLVSVYFELQSKFNITFDMTDLRLDKNTDRPFLLAYCASNPKQHRDKFFSLIQQQDSTAHGIGRCCTTPGRQVGEHATWRDNWQYFKNYRFTMAMENVAMPGYVTEKLLNAILAGSIPIYYGDPVWVKKVFNPNAIIFVQDFPTLEECANYILKVDRDPVLLKQYQTEKIYIQDISWFTTDKNKISDDYKKIIEILIKNIKIPTVVHKYLTTCQLNPQPPGFADFIRGTLVLYQKAKMNNYKLEIDYNHPILQLLKNKSDNQYSGHTHEIISPLNFPYQNKLLDKLFVSGKDFNVLTNILPENFYNTNLDDDTKQFLRKFLVPNDEITTAVNYFRQMIGENYVVIHIRTGDHYMLTNSDSNNLEIYNKAMELITSIKNNPILIISDNYVLKQKIKNNFNVFYTPTNPIHSGSLSDLDQIYRLKGTLFDFNIMSFSSTIYRISPEGSGFSYICSKIYDIPFIHV